MRIRHLLLTPLFLACVTAGAQTINFESYTAGSLASVGAPTNNDFTGQDGWSKSSSTGAGNVTTTTTSGEYTGGKALAGGTLANPALTYIGANQGYLLGNSYSFDARFGTEVGVGHWNDDDGNALFSQGESELMVGVVSPGDNNFYFGIRTAGFGTRKYADASGGTITSGAGVTGTAGHWYHFTVSYLANGSNYDITLAVRNLTTGTDIDFNSSLAGVQPWVTTVTSAEFGVATSDAEGLGIRVTTNINGNGLIDNINTSPGSGSPYETWAGPGVLFDADANDDGVKNGMAFLLGASGPNVSALDKLPVVTQTGGDLKMTFDMLPSAARGSALLFVEHSNDLVNWSDGELVLDSSGGTAPVTFTVSDSDLNDSENPLDVEVTISASEADVGKLFGRLKAVNP